MPFYTPDTLLLTPAASETIDTMVSGISGGTADFVFGAASFGPGTIYGMRVIESKVLAAPVVLDSKANGKLYLSAISLAEKARRSRLGLQFDGNLVWLDYSSDPDHKTHSDARLKPLALGERFLNPFAAAALELELGRGSPRCAIDRPVP